jgi:Recombinase
LNDQMGDLFMTVNEFFRSNGESRRKRGWAHKKWEKRRALAAEGKVFKMKHPTWVRFVPSHPKSQEGKYVVVAKCANVVRDIFEQYNDGQSVYAITKKLNRRSVKTFSGKTWSASLVKYLLRSRSVLGEYQPKRIIDGKRKDEGEPIKAFFPAIIKESVYNRAQARWKTVPNRNGRPPADEADEILSGLICCPYCGGSIGVQESNTKHLLACNKSFENACVRVAVKRHFVEWCAAASTEEIYNSISLGDDNSATIQAIEGKLADLSKQKARLVKLVMSGVAEAEQQVMRLEKMAKSLSEELQAERNLELTNEADGDAFVEAFVTNSMDRETRLKAVAYTRSNYRTRPHSIGAEFPFTCSMALG